MAAKTSSLATPSRFSRLGIGRAAKSHSASPRPHSSGNPTPDGEDGEEWYIPYNGPYEAPKQSHQTRKRRDSWGDVITGEEDDAVPDDKDLHRSYPEQHQRNDPQRSVGAENEREGRTRRRVVSNMSHQTISSGAVDHNRHSVGLARRRSAHSSGSHRRPAPSYINLDAVGGVGESPIPPRRVYPTQEGSNANRGSIANFFNFGQNKKVASALSKSGTSVSSSRTTARPGTAPSPSATAEWDRNNPLVRRRLENTLTLDTSGARSSAKMDDHDYYNSYYSTLVTTPKRKSDELKASASKPPLPTQRQHLTIEQHNISPLSPSTSIKEHHHPYAYVFPSAALSQSPQSAHPASDGTEAPGNNSPGHNAPAVTITEPSKLTTSPRGIHFPPTEKHGAYPRGVLKASTSTPNLRNSSSDQPLPMLRAQLPTGKDRWLSAETWCDALLFPRPRFKIKHDGDKLGWSGRIVSPPASPISGEFDNGSLSHKGQIGVQSRVLAHSRSAADPANSSLWAGPSNPSKAPRPKEAPVPLDKLEQPRSFAQDDLALPSPTPSLTRVLEEGQLLENQRQRWRVQATQSFQNKRSRSVSRSRSKSFTHMHPQARYKDSNCGGLGDMSTLGARTFLGNQAVMPVVAPRRRSSLGNATKSGTFSSASHSHSNSLSKTSSKASHHRGHSRNESWGKSALKVAKSTAAFCGLNGDPIDPPQVNEKESALEDALRAEGTKVIRLVDPAQIAPDTLVNDNKTMGVTPTPSGSYENVGIALSTPPTSDLGHTYEPIRLLDHPYAQGTIYPHHRDVPAVSESIHGSIKGSDYAGPHPSTSNLGAVAVKVDASNVSTRHRLPPQATWHPYAMAGSRDSYFSEEKVLPRVRMDSDVPPPAKMWAQGPSGEIEEILPSEIVYSPFTPEDNRSYGHSPEVNDTVGVGEALTLSMRHGGRAGRFGIGENHAKGNSEQPGTESDEDVRIKDGDTVFVAPRVHRKTVQYDISRPIHYQGSAQTPDPTFNHVQAEALFPSNTSPDASGSSPYETSSTSSHQASPRALSPDSEDDLDRYRDLFYRPSSSGSRSRQTITHHDPSLSWDVRPHGDRAATGLTGLARKLNDGSEELNAAGGPSVDAVTNPKASESLAAQQPIDISPDFHFVFSDTHQVVLPSGSATPSRLPEQGSAFKPAMNIPEDIESSRASSPLQRSPPEDEDTMRMYRVGHAEVASTPPAVSNDRRLPDHPSPSNEPIREVQENAEIDSHQIRIKSQTSLHPPSAGLTRSSYMTTSTAGSRMSGLSDFPAPPGQAEVTPAHMSLFDSYFDESSSPRARDSFGLSSGSRTISRRMTFGGDEDIEDIANALSSHS